MHPDHRAFIRFTGRARLEKAINSLVGIVEGIAIDRRINPAEEAFLQLWLQDQSAFANRHPFNELVPVVHAAVSDGVLTEEERADILWLCRNLQSDEYVEQAKGDMQRLHGVLGGIMADGQITEDELRGLTTWLSSHEHLRSCWPYDEVDSLVTSVLADRRIDPDEHAALKAFFSEFVALLDERTVVSPSMSSGATLVGVCAVTPEITFAGSTFCFTGASVRYTRAQLAKTVTSLGGEVLDNVSGKVRYLVIGAEGNPCWAYACYGRKVEKAVELRKAGARLLIVHENDFHDAVADHG
jgi:tellurite resistance protein